ncbi:MAG: peptidoglycan-binding protein [Verrucomicrobiales bacterium]|nr:peptidoglycan-binding protein [Verrucomicrobiales bacterium]
MIRSIDSYLEQLHQAAALESSFPGEDSVFEMLADREAEMVMQSLPQLEPLPPMRSPGGELIGDQPGQISQQAYNLIVAFETGGKAYYEEVYKSAPCWPGLQSGITIGFGFDLGYYTDAAFETAWAGHLSPADFSRLKSCIGFTTTEPDRSSKVDKAKRWIRQFQDISIPWSMGESVYHEYTIPGQLRLVHKYVPGASSLPPHCFGALLSLVFNRGASFDRQGQRYREMRAIKRHISNGMPERVPAEIRSMKRLWKSRGLRARREEEAKLFEKGLIGMVRIEGLNDTDYTFDPWAEDVAVESDNGEPVWRDVCWARNDESHPDYRHIAGLGEGELNFEFRARDLELLIRANEFQPVDQNGVVLFALRGCRLQYGDSAIRKQSLYLVDQRPDHRQLRCVIGVYHRNSGELSAYTGSTVPNARFVWNYSEYKNAGNLLPTGCYRYKTGAHSGGRYPNCLLLDEPSLVLRTTNDLSYGTKDRWEPGKVWNNIHPSFSTFEWADYSSAGSLTVKGSYYQDRGYTGEWSKFQQDAGITGDGKFFHLVLLTGLEARIAAGLRLAGISDSSHPKVVERLSRLRSGSRGERVKELQRGLRVIVDGEFGAKTRQALVGKQRNCGVVADAIFSNETDDVFGFGIYPPEELPALEVVALPAVDRSPDLFDDSDIPPSSVTEFPDDGAVVARRDENDYFPQIFEESGDENQTRGGLVYWPSQDCHSPCYYHLITDGSSDLPDPAAFELGVEEMELLIAGNRFAPMGKDDVIGFGIRGAKIRFSQEKVEEVESIPLKDARPDHRNFHCVLGFYFRSRGTFAAYTGSTVPWHQYMAKGIKNNLLPTGCYIYKVGEHRPADSSRWVQGLRMSDANGAWSGPATVLRTRNDLVFGLADAWDQCKPSDNIHCAYSNTKFSSLGCQTVKGGKGYGLWNEYQKQLLQLGPDSRVDYILLTGMDIAVAHTLSDAGSPADLKRITRLRTGSCGEDVKRLQARLAMNQTGYFGAATKYRLTCFQAANELPRDGIYTPALDEKLRWGIFQFPGTPSAISPATEPPLQATQGPKYSVNTAPVVVMPNPGKRPPMKPVIPGQDPDSAG